MLWTGIRKSGGTALNLSGARINHLRDDRESWPHVDNLDLNGLVYGELTLHERPSEGDIAQRAYGRGLPFDADQRIEWLELQPIEERIEPQPWLQLSKHLESKGDRKDAKHGNLQFRNLRARTQEKSWGSRRWAIFFAWLEEAPLRILTLDRCHCRCWYFHFYWSSSQPRNDPVYSCSPQWRQSPVSDHYPPFQPIIYSLENSLRREVRYG